MAERSDRGGELADGFVAEARRQLGASRDMIRHGLDQLDDGQVWWRPREEMNSIGNLVLHLAGNLRQRFRSVIGGEPDDRDRFGEFTERRAIPKGELLARFEGAVADADARLAGLSVEGLLGRREYTVLAGKAEATVQSLVFATLTHLAGHTQEILHLTRAQLGDRYAFRQPAGVPPRASR